ncbi:MAG TPA: HAD family phosphatase [Rubrivivax sp.]|nr:HAD family phosphatase [Rubrivivax sp.]HRZ60856.1 HAD family phosphatase [Rubrivivax sp.]
MSPPRHLVFDFAGVLFRWRPLVLLQQVLPQRAHDAASALRLAAAIFQGYEGDWADFDRGRVQPDALVQRIAARTGLPAAELRRVVDAVPAELQPQPAVVALLARLRAAGRRLYYLSNMPEVYAQHLERTHEVVGWFDDGVISARVGLVKPEPAIFALAAQRFGAAPAELLFIDDIAANVRAAQAAGWQALQFDDAAQCEAALHARGLLG